MTDFSVSEFEARLIRAQAAMTVEGFDALFLNTEAEFRYFTGFRSLFWQSPTRPWFVIVPQSGELTVVIPSIGTDLMQRMWVNDIRTWPSPRGEDEGVSLLIEALGAFDRIGVPMGEESSLRMSLTDFRAVEASITIGAARANGGVCTELGQSGGTLGAGKLAFGGERAAPACVGLGVPEH